LDDDGADCLHLSLLPRGRELDDVGPSRRPPLLPRASCPLPPRESRPLRCCLGELLLGGDLLDCLGERERLERGDLDRCLPGDREGERDLLLEDDFERRGDLLRDLDLEPPLDESGLALPNSSSSSPSAPFVPSSLLGETPTLSSSV
jgi:hypothetical protein